MRDKILAKTSIVTHTIKSGLAMVIPVLFVGSISVLLNKFPVMAYQDFLDSFLGGALRSIIGVVQNATVGLLAVYITIALNISYVNRSKDRVGIVYRIGSMLGCLTGYFILVGFFVGETDVTLLSGQGVFSAMIAGIVGSVLFKEFERRFNLEKKVFFDGTGSEFNAALRVILPFVCVALCFAVFNYLITVFFQVDSMQHLFMKAMDAIFVTMQRSYLSGVLYIFLIGIMWFLGIHGNNVLNQVSEDMFVQIIPGETISQSFIDTFVNMGGTGCLLGLLIALIVFGKRNTTKKLSYMAFLPGVFNIGEMLVFGLPIIYNPLMLIPFIASPIVCFTSAFLFTQVGFLPQVTDSVVWSTPAIISGYLATGSLRGIIVQLINILLSAACYAPFVIIYEKKAIGEFSSAYTRIVDVYKQSEKESKDIVLTDWPGEIGRYSKQLAMDLEASLSQQTSDKYVVNVDSPITIYYEREFDEKGKPKGATALMKWEHKQCGKIYSPLVAELAKESGDLYRLETYIIRSAVSDAEGFREEYGEDYVVNVNISMQTFLNKKCVAFLQSIADKYRLKAGYISLKIINDEEFDMTEDTEKLLDQIKSFGYTIK